MSSVTLQTLRADFDTQQEMMWPGIIHKPSLEDTDRNGEFVLTEVVCEGETEHLLIRRIVIAARTYLVARDYGFEAARMFRLSDGRLDPRKP